MEFMKQLDAYKETSKTKYKFKFVLGVNEHGEVIDSICTAVTIHEFTLNLYLKTLKNVYDTILTDVSSHIVVTKEGTWSEIKYWIHEVYQINLDDSNVIELYPIPGIEKMFALPDNAYADILDILYDACGYSMMSIASSEGFGEKCYQLKEILNSKYLIGNCVSELSNFINILWKNYVPLILAVEECGELTDKTMKLMSDFGFPMFQTRSFEDVYLDYYEVLDMNYFIYLYLNDYVTLAI